MPDGSTLFDYFKILIKRSLASFHASDGAVTIITYLALVALSLFASGAFSDQFGPSISVYGTYFAVGWLVLSLTIITPFRMWRDERRVVDKMKERSKPLLQVSDLKERRYPDGHATVQSFDIEIQNTDSY